MAQTMFDMFGATVAIETKRVQSLPHIEAVSDFCEKANLNRTDSLYLKKRDRLTGRNPLEFGWFRISYSEGWEWWTPYIGIEFLGLFPGKYGYQDRVSTCRCVGHTKIVVGNDILFNHLTLL